MQVPPTPLSRELGAIGEGNGRQDIQHDRAREDGGSGIVQGAQQVSKEVGGINEKVLALDGKIESIATRVDSANPGADYMETQMKKFKEDMGQRSQ